MLTTQQRRKNLPQSPPNRRTDRAPNALTIRIHRASTRFHPETGTFPTGLSSKRGFSIYDRLVLPGT